MMLQFLFILSQLDFKSLLVWRPSILFLLSLDHKTQYRIVHLAYLNIEYVFVNYTSTSMFLYFVAPLKSEGDLFLTK